MYGIYFPPRYINMKPSKFYCLLNCVSKKLAMELLLNVNVTLQLLSISLMEGIGNSYN